MRFCCSCTKKAPGRVDCRRTSGSSACDARRCGLSLPPAPTALFQLPMFCGKNESFFKTAGEMAKQPELVATESCYYPPASMKLIHSRETASSWCPCSPGTRQPKGLPGSAPFGSQEGWQGSSCPTASPALTHQLTQSSSLTINYSSGDCFRVGASDAVSQVSRGSERFVSSELVLLPRAWKIMWKGRKSAEVWRCRLSPGRRLSVPC